MLKKLGKENEKMSIYRRWYAEIYEINETGTEDINLLLSLIGDNCRKVLEVACGGGRILVPLALAGHDTKGFDMDEERLAYIPEKAKELKNLQYCCMDAVSGDWKGGYEVVVLAGNLLHNVEADMPYDKTQQFFIQKAASSLKIGGYIFLDFGMFAQPEEIFSKDNGRVIFEGTDSYGVYGKHVVIGDGYDARTQIAYGRRLTELHMPDNHQEIIHETWEKHIPTLEQVHKWLIESGFKVVNEFGDYNRNPIDESTYRAIIWAERTN
ncbi:class I SAM-dependent methyltransferase [Clostridium sp. 19966]|uniref:class I SAM-dependent methyltransferase n=1 Tax=Clostridium sp. 19966 TaxID=2768166 RepID=UPI0028E030B5|nr:class I SAM-dependent methyltransferase [Clostridium sp. 19966]MDT8719162.1 class I SAM-dependent methyltransferase [Clostridium sp. 19966]